MHPRARPGGWYGWRLTVGAKLPACLVEPALTVECPPLGAGASWPQALLLGRARETALGYVAAGWRRLPACGRQAGSGSARRPRCQASTQCHRQPLIVIWTALAGAASRHQGLGGGRTIGRRSGRRDKEPRSRGGGRPGARCRRWWCSTGVVISAC
jgi:hypothetical protein